MTALARHPFKLPVLAGVLLAFGYFTLGLVVPSLVALVPLLIWLDANLDRPWRFFRNGGFVFGMAWNLLILHWMRAMLQMSFLAIFAYVGLAAIFAAGSALLVIVLAWTRKRTGWSYAILLPSVWLTLEWVLAHGDLRMTAQHLGQSAATYPFLVQFADLGGPYGIGLVLLLSNVFLFDAWSASGRKPRAFAVASWLVLIGGVLAYDAWSWGHPPQPAGTLKVGLVQPNVPLLEKMDPATDAAQQKLLFDLTRRAAGQGAQVIVWPETAWPRPFYHWPDRPQTYAIGDVQSLARELGVTLVVGAEYGIVRNNRPQAFYNAVFVVHPDGKLDDAWSAKVYLVPFVEAVPFKPVLGPLLSGRGGWMHWLAGGFTPGPRIAPLPVDGTAIGVSVCYEELYFDLQRKLRNAGAKIQAVITNDAWFGTTFFQTYQANTDRLRAIENRTSFVRVANSGISAFIDPLGRDLAWTDLNVEDVRVGELPLAGPPTVYDRAGDVPAWLAAAGLVTACAAAWRRSR
ncbi:MAG TPA: apolipoprotein N-acyltransferase [Candidatus Polarisedimenticolaceae bacterium]|nr:apolipoprotein N-acyltransferase [Candidatus Polarisedimenticolaceae bacterium]